MNRLSCKKKRLTYYIKMSLINTEQLSKSVIYVFICCTVLMMVKHKFITKHLYLNSHAGNGKTTHKTYQNTIYEENINQ